MTLKSDAKFQEKTIYCFKTVKNLVNFDPSTRKSQNLYFSGLFLTKLENASARKVQKSYV